MLHLRVEQIAPTEADAANSAQALGNCVQLIKAIQPKVEAQSDKPDADALRRFTSSLKIEQHKDRTIFTASVPLELVKKLATPMNSSNPEPFPTETNPPASTSP